jgi:membrane-bound ClpP family serine protease
MLVIGIALILIGLLVPGLGVLFTIGVILAVLGAVLLALSYSGHGPRLW